MSIPAPPVTLDGAPPPSEAENKKYAWRQQKSLALFGAMCLPCSVWNVPHPTPL